MVLDKNCDLIVEAAQVAEGWSEQVLLNLASEIDEEDSSFEIP